MGRFPDFSSVVFFSAALFSTGGVSRRGSSDDTLGDGFARAAFGDAFCEAGTAVGWSPAFFWAGGISPAALAGDASCLVFGAGFVTVPVDEAAADETFDVVGAVVDRACAFLAVAGVFRSAFGEGLAVFDGAFGSVACLPFRASISAVESAFVFFIILFLLSSTAVRVFEGQ